MTTTTLQKPSGQVSKLRGKDPKTAKPSKAKIIIYGPPGVGKTWTSIEFPSVYYIDTEGGANREHYTDKLKAAGGVYMGQQEGSLDFGTVLEQVHALATEKHEYRTLVLDSFTKLYNTEAALAAERFVKAEKNPNAMGDEFGRDRKEANKPTRRLINWLNRLDMNVVLICHEKAQWLNGEQAGFTFDGYDKLSYELDLTLHIQRRGDARVAVVKKTRLLGFPELSVFPWGYKEFSERYGRDVIETNVQAITLASAEQVAEIKKLVETIRVSDEEMAKAFTKYGVSSFEEMDADTIQASINNLKGKLK